MRKSLMVVACMLAPSIADAASIQWIPARIDRELYAIAGLESHWGKYQDHQPNSRGPFYSAYGPLGLKASTAYMEYARSPYLRNKFPELLDQDAFLAQFVSNPELYYSCANVHWNWLRRNTSSLEQAVYSWRWGWGAATSVDESTMTSDEYVVKYGTLVHNVQIATW